MRRQVDTGATDKMTFEPWSALSHDDVASVRYAAAVCSVHIRRANKLDPGLHHIIGSMIMSLCPATPSTIEDRLPSCLPPSATLTVSLFAIHVTVRNQRPRDFHFWLLHKTLHTSNQVHSHRFVSVHNSILSIPCRIHNHFTLSLQLSLAPSCCSM